MKYFSSNDGRWLLLKRAKPPTVLTLKCKLIQTQPQILTFFIGFLSLKKLKILVSQKEELKNLRFDPPKVSFVNHKLPVKKGTIVVIGPLFLPEKVLLKKKKIQHYCKINTFFTSLRI